MYGLYILVHVYLEPLVMSSGIIFAFVNRFSDKNRPINSPRETNKQLFSNGNIIYSVLFFDFGSLVTKKSSEGSW